MPLLCFICLSSSVVIQPPSPLPLVAHNINHATYVQVNYLEKNGLILDVKYMLMFDF